MYSAAVPATVLITGVSRRQGIGAALAARWRSDGLTVLTSGWTPYDRRYHAGIDEQAASDFQYDLGDSDAARALTAAATRRAGELDALVIAHACDSRSPVVVRDGS